MPGLKVRCLDWTDTEQDAQPFQIGGSLSQRGIEAAAPLLDKPKMEARRVGDRLDVVSGGQIGIRSGNGRKLPFQQPWDGWGESVPEIGVLRAAAVARPPAGIYGELHQVGEPELVLLCACRLTALQRAKLIQVDGVRALVSQLSIDEGEVADFILGIVVDILGHGPIQL